MSVVEPMFLGCYEAVCEKCGNTVYHEMNPNCNAKQRPHYCPRCGKFVKGEPRGMVSE